MNETEKQYENAAIFLYFMVFYVAINSQEDWLFTTLFKWCNPYTIPVIVFVGVLLAHAMEKPTTKLAQLFERTNIPAGALKVIFGIGGFVWLEIFCR